MNRKIRITEGALRKIVNESVKKVLKQAVFEAAKNCSAIPVKKKLGKWNCIDGQWWDGTPYGLEHKGLVQDVRMYDKETNDDTFETIALFRRCDNKKFFYAQIVPIENSKDTKWKPLPLSKVPEIIKNDIRTINTQGHEPYPTCLT